MSKKYELLKITKVLEQHLKLNALANYIQKLTNGIDLSKYFETCEMTLFLYNCVINIDIQMNAETDVKHLISLYKMIYADVIFTDDNVRKINADVAYIKTKKLFSKISNTYYYLNSTYNFFFCPNIYVIEQ